MTTIRKEVIKILKDSKRAITCKQIYKKILKRDKLRLRSTTPVNSINSMITTDIKTKGDKSLILRTKKGFYKIKKANSTNLV